MTHFVGVESSGLGQQTVVRTTCFPCRAVKSERDRSRKVIKQRSLTEADWVVSRQKIERKTDEWAALVRNNYTQEEIENQPIVDHCNEEVRKRQARRAALAPLLMQESSAKSRPEPEAPTVASTHPLMESENVGPTAPPQPETSGVTTQPTPTRDQLYSMVYPKIKCRSHWRQNLGEHFAPRCYFGSEGEDCIVCRITDAVHAAEGVGGEVEDARVFTRSILSEDGEDLVQDWNESVLKKFDYAVPDKVGKHHIVEHFLRRQNDVEVLDYPDFDELFGLNAPEEAVTKAVQDNLDQPQIPGLAMSQGTTAAAPQSLTTSHTEPKPGSTRETRSANSSVKELAKRMADDKHKRKRSSPPAYPATRGLCEYVNPGKRAAFDHQGASEQV